MTTILVTGGTGALGRQVVPLLAQRGAQVRILSRRSQQVNGAEVMQGDLATGAGLAEAVRGADVVVHCATDPRLGRTDVRGTGQLLEAATAAARPHVVYISIVGIDRIPFGYYRTKAGLGGSHPRQRAALDGAARYPVPRPRAAGRRCAGQATPRRGPAGDGHATGRHR
jgi:uncharacterized protein YbjT (DUF2867 family)